MQELLIETIRTDGGVQSRERINNEYVAELAELIKAGKKLPPIEVYSDSGEVWAADGFHRILAHQQAGKRTIRCNVHRGGQQDAAWASCAANQEHGLRRQKGDIEKAVKMAVALKPSLSQEAIAQHVGCSREYVNRLCTVHNLKRPATVTGTDGKEYPARKIRPPWEVQPQGDTPRIPPPPPSGNPPPPCGNPPPPPPVPAKAHEAAARLDEVGKPIPDHLLPLFDRASEVQALLGQLSSIKGVLKRAEASGDVLYGEVNFNSALAAIETLHMEIKSTKPYAVCPWCHGNLSDQCRGCGHRGVLGQFRWSNTVQRSLKGES
jgi:hypothetical protein